MSVAGVGIGLLTAPGGFLLLIAALAAVLPARRAGAIDPAQGLCDQ